MPGPIFSLQYVHSALENALRDLVQKAAAVTNSASRSAAAELLEAQTFAAQVLRGHAEAENSALMPAVEAAVVKAGRPGVAADYLDDHVRELAQMDQITAAVQALIDRGSHGGAEWSAVRQSLQHCLETATEHMHKEETELWPLVDALFTPPEQGQIMQAIGATFKPADMVAIAPWVVRNLDAATRVLYVGMMRGAFPPQVYAKAVGWIRDGVSPEVWQTVEAHV